MRGARSLGWLCHRNPAKFPSKLGDDNGRTTRQFHPFRRVGRAPSRQTSSRCNSCDIRGHVVSYNLARTYSYYVRRNIQQIRRSIQVCHSDGTERCRTNGYKHIGNDCQKKSENENTRRRRLNCHIILLAKKYQKGHGPQPPHSSESSKPLRRQKTKTEEGAKTIARYRHRYEDYIPVTLDDLREIKGFGWLQQAMFGMGMFFFSGAFWLLMAILADQKKLEITPWMGMCGLSIIFGFSLMAVGVVIHYLRNKRLDKYFKEDPLDISKDLLT